MSLSRKKELLSKEIALDLKVKGDKFLYYKRQIQAVEDQIKLFPFWNNAYVWIFITYSLVTFYFLFFIIERTYFLFPSNISFFLFENISLFFSKQILYLYIIIPILNFIITLILSYNLYNSRRVIAYTLITINIVCTLLFMIGFVKSSQMNYAIVHL